MNGFHRLHALRMLNDAKGFEMDEMRPRFDRIGNRHEDRTAPRAVAAYQLFQTPADVASLMVAALDIAPGARVLEPSAGLGRLLDAVRALRPSEVVAVEMAPACAGELFRQNRAGVRILQRDFLTVTPEEVGLFDAIVMNPPFHLRDDIRHILHARKFLRPGRSLVALCLNGPHRERELKPIAETWELLLEKSFKESGTNVGVVMLAMRGLQIAA